MAIKIFRIILRFFSILLVFAALSTPVQAQCVSVPSSGCTSTDDTKYFCSITVNSFTHQGCCPGSNECKSFKENYTSVKTIGTINPEGSCSDGIETALGCLPYKSEGGAFTNALLTFLAGIVGAIALVVMLMATIGIMTAGGNPEQVQKGKELLTGAITGILFIIFSVTLLRLIAGDIIKLEGF